MHFVPLTRNFVLFVLITLPTIPHSLMAQSRIVSLADLQSELVINSQTRPHKLDTVRHFLCSPKRRRLWHPLT
jgi:hypothetical protein